MVFLRDAVNISAVTNSSSVIVIMRRQGSSLQLIWQVDLRRCSPDTPAPMVLEVLHRQSLPNSMWYRHCSFIRIVWGKYSHIDFMDTTLLLCLHCEADRATPWDWPYNIGTVQNKQGLMKRRFLLKISSFRAKDMRAFSPITVAETGNSPTVPLQNEAMIIATLLGRFCLSSHQKTESVFCMYLVHSIQKILCLGSIWKQFDNSSARCVTLVWEALWVSKIQWC